MHEGLVLRELAAAYKCLVEISAETLTAEQRGNLIVMERHLILAMQHAAKNPLERGAVARFLERMQARERGVEGP